MFERCSAESYFEKVFCENTRTQSGSAYKRSLNCEDMRGEDMSQERAPFPANRERTSSEYRYHRLLARIVTTNIHIWFFSV
jgi:hypothetical protein